MSLFTDESGSVKPWVTYAVIGIVILGGGYFVWGAWTKDSRSPEIQMMCHECEYSRTRRLEVGEDMPGPCPKCGKYAVVPARPCPKCKSPVALNDYMGIKPPTKCKKCGTEVWHGM